MTDSIIITYDENNYHCRAMRPVHGWYAKIALDKSLAFLDNSALAQSLRTIRFERRSFNRTVQHALIDGWQGSANETAQSAVNPANDELAKCILELNAC